MPQSAPRGWSLVVVIIRAMGFRDSAVPGIVLVGVILVTGVACLAVDGDGVDAHLHRHEHAVGVHGEGADIAEHRDGGALRVGRYETEDADADRERQSGMASPGPLHDAT